MLLDSRSEASSIHAGPGPSRARDARLSFSMGDHAPRARARRTDRVLISAYHEANADLLEHVRAGFTAYDAGQIDAFELDDIIHQYKRAARELWKFCAVSGSRAEWAARILEAWKAEGKEPDWWEAGAWRKP